jgi:hypothetical protein
MAAGAPYCGVMPRRSAAALASIAIVLALATGCTPEPDPVETTPAAGFASEEEAFAAAEETYRAYVDALNQVDLADPATFEPMFEHTTGDANARARQEFSQMHADGWVVGGQSDLVAMHIVEASLPAELDADVCVDVSSVTLTNPAGESMVSSDRPDQQRMRVSFVADGSDGWLIEMFAPTEGADPCE